MQQYKTNKKMGGKTQLKANRKIETANQLPMEYVYRNIQLHVATLTVQIKYVFTDSNPVLNFKFHPSIIYGLILLTSLFQE